MSKRLYGLIVPLITPFKEDLSLDIDALKWLVGYLVKNNVDAIFPVSTTGEFPSLTNSEKIKIVEVVREYTPTNIKVIAGISSTSLYEAVDLALRFKDLGVDSLISTPPYYYKGNLDGVKRYFRMILDRIEIPLILYTIPQYTGIDIPPELIKELVMEYDDLVGLKATVDSMIYFRKIIQLVKPIKKDFNVYSGIDEYILPLILIGGDGAVSALAHITPNLHKEMIEALFNGELAKANELYNIILDIKRIYDISKSVSGAIKLTLESFNTPIKRFVRPPLTDENLDNIDIIRSILSRYRDKIVLYKEG